MPCRAAIFAAFAYDQLVDSANNAQTVDVAVIGAGAAGLATAIFTARRMPAWRIFAFDGARKLGAKILVSGGGRCNVTNVRVTPADFFGAPPNVVKRILAAFNEGDTVGWFAELGVALHEEENGKLFPDSNDAQTVLDALLADSSRRGVTLASGCRVIDVTSETDGFRVEFASPHSPTTADHDVLVDPSATTATPTHRLKTRHVVLATGGRSLPKTGSDGGGYELARRLGHSINEPTPALVPLILDGDFHVPLSGIAQDVEVVVRIEGQKPRRIRGAMLWTHFGVSGPAILDASRHWHRAKLEERPVKIEINFAPDLDLPAVDQRVLDAVARQPTTQLHNTLSLWFPARFGEAVLRHLNIDGRVPMAHLRKDDRRKLVQSLLAWPLPVRDSRGYNFAEVTAGGVPLSEVDPATMVSRKCPGLFLVGEILDVDGRIGGFNFQWAWSTAWVAAAGLATLPPLRHSDQGGFSSNGRAESRIP